MRRLGFLLLLGPCVLLDGFTVTATTQESAFDGDNTHAASVAFHFKVRR